MQPPPLALAPLGPVQSGTADDSRVQVLRDPRLAALPEHLEPLRLLGHGGSSVVYEARHTRLKINVALKLLTIEGPFAEQAQKRMLREANLYALLDDPRIPRVYDVNELPDGTPYVVMEMVPGASLEDLLAQRGALSPKHALAITREVLLVLESVHERGILHRDVKPANVILKLSEQGPSDMRLVDFGIAKMSTRGSGEEAVTQRGALIGTPHYMAPECLAGHPAEASTDVYSVGIMLYEMLAGAVPFTGPSLATIMAAVMREVPPTLHERGVGVSPALSQLVMKAMAREPSDRFSSARDMLAALDALSADGARPAASHAVEHAPRARRRGRFWFLAALLSILLISAGFLLAGTRIEPRAETEAAHASSSASAAQTAPSTSTRPPAALSPRSPEVLPGKSPLSLEPAAEQASDRESRQRTRAERRHSRSDDGPRYYRPRAGDTVILPENPY